MSTRPIHLSRLVPHPDNVRENLGDLTELAASIRSQGIIQPIVAEPRPDGKTYTIIAGHRRHAAAKLARLDMVPVTIRPATGSAAKAIELMLVENCQRRNLGPIEKAEAMGALRERGYSASAIARAIGLTPSTVSNYLAMLELDDETRERVREGQVQAGHAMKAIRHARRSTRKAKGLPKTGRPVQAERPWFTDRHALASTARAMCGHTSRPMVGNVACGQCWEQAIREDKPEPEDAGPERFSVRDERLQMLASMRLHDGNDQPPPGILTSAQAAEQLGVTKRTIERYKADLRMAGAS